MRLDYPLYGVAIICFVIAIYAYAAPLTGIHELYLYTLAVLGIVFIGLGYVARPKSTALAPSKPTPLSSAEPAPKPKEQPKAELSEEPKKTSTTERAQKKKTTRRRRRKKAT